MRATRRLRGAIKENSAYRHLGRALDSWATERAFTRLIETSDNFGDTKWLGHPIWQNILDVWTIQEAISEIKPEVLLETGTNRGGSAMFYASLFDLIGNGHVVTVDVERLHEREHPRVEFLIGSSVGETVLDRMREVAAGTSGPVMVVLDSDHSQSHVAAELGAYSPLVTSGSLMLVQDGVIDELPSMTSARPGPLPAIREFLAGHTDFYVDDRWNRRFTMTHHPDGWIRRR